MPCRKNQVAAVIIQLCINNQMVVVTIYNVAIAVGSRNHSIMYMSQYSGGSFDHSVTLQYQVVALTIPQCSNNQVVAVNNL